MTRQQQLLLAAVEDETLVPYEAPVVAAAWSLNGQRLALVDQQTVRTAEVLSDGTLDTSKGLKIEPKSQVRFPYKAMLIACMLMSSLTEQVSPAFWLLCVQDSSALAGWALQLLLSPTPAQDWKHTTRG